MAPPHYSKTAIAEQRSPALSPVGRALRLQRADPGRQRPEAMRSLVTNMAVPSGFTPWVNKALRDTNFPYVVPV
jgi:hypothetical protein